jgi:hypothetical protein
LVKEGTSLRVLCRIGAHFQGKRSSIWIEDIGSVVDLPTNVFSIPRVPFIISLWRVITPCLFILQDGLIYEGGCPITKRFIVLGVKTVATTKEIHPIRKPTNFLQEAIIFLEFLGQIRSGYLYWSTSASEGTFLLEGTTSTTRKRVGPWRSFVFNLWRIFGIYISIFYCILEAYSATNSHISYANGLTNPLLEILYPQTDLTQILKAYI